MAISSIKDVSQMAYKDFIKKTFDEIPEYYQNALKIGLAGREEKVDDIVCIKINEENFNKQNEYGDIFVYLYAWTKEEAYAMYIDREINMVNSIPILKD